VREADPVAEGREAGACGRQGLAVPVNGEQTALRATRQQRRTVPPSPTVPSR